MLVMYKHRWKPASLGSYSHENINKQILVYRPSDISICITYSETSPLLLVSIITDMQLQMSFLVVKALLWHQLLLKNALIVPEIQSHYSVLWHSTAGPGKRRSAEHSKMAQSLSRCPQGSLQEVMEINSTGVPKIARSGWTKDDFQ